MAPAAHEPGRSRLEIATVTTVMLAFCEATITGRPPASDIVDQVSEWTDREWLDLVFVASRSNVESLIATHALACSPPFWVQRLFGATIGYHARRAARLLSEAREITAILGKLDVVPVARKGIGSLSLYESMSLRGMQDIDFLVGRDDLLLVSREMRARGFNEGTVHVWTEPDRATRLFYMLGTAAAPPLVRAVDDMPELREVTLDFATSLFLPKAGYGTSAELVRSRAVCWEVSGEGPLWVPDRIDMVLDLCASVFLTNTTLHYIWRRRYRRLTPYVDLGLALRAMSFDVASIVERAQAESMEEPLAFGLGNFNRLFPGVLDGDEIENLVGSIGDPIFLDRLGQWDTADDLRWDVPLTERLFGDPPLPPGLPTAKALL